VELKRQQRYPVNISKKYFTFKICIKEVLMFKKKNQKNEKNQKIEKQFAGLKKRTLYLTR